MRKINLLILLLLPIVLLLIFLKLNSNIKAVIFVLLFLIDFLILRKDLKSYEKKIKSEIVIKNDKKNEVVETFKEADVVADVKSSVDKSIFDNCFADMNNIIDSVDIDNEAGELDGLTQKFIPNLTDATMNSQAIKGSVSQIFTISDNLAKTTQTAFDLANSVQNSINYVSKTLEKAINVTHELDVKSTEISKILDIMSDISSMVHILSINASIVSARAGIHGEGFKVVAKEIRNLAVNTDKSLSDIDAHVKDVQNAVEKVAIEIKEAGRAIEEESTELRDVAGALQGVLLSVEIINTVSGAAKDTTEEQTRSFSILKNSVDELIIYLNNKKSLDNEQLLKCRNRMKSLTTNMNELVNNNFKEST